MLERFPKRWKNPGVLQSSTFALNHCFFAFRQSAIEMSCELNFYLATVVCIHDIFVFAMLSVHLKIFHLIYCIGVALSLSLGPFQLLTDFKEFQKLCLIGL